MAAYKHVPLVEVNPMQGLENIFYKVLCEKALKYSVNKFVLISSDKAVRPTNLWGLQRISELIVQAFHEESLKKATIFLMVRLEMF